MMTRLRLFKVSPTMLAAFFLASCSLLGLFSAPSIVGDVRAQAPTWVKIQQFSAADGYISSIWATNPQIVVIGWHWNIASSDVGMVMRTTDGGVTWKNCTIPALTNGSTPQVTDIWFLTPDTGWLTLAGDLNLGDSRLWRTVDSGKTWTALWNGITTMPFTGNTEGLAAVWQTDSTLVVTQNLFVGVWYSKDTGRTWLSHPTLHENGVAFDDLDGVASEFGQKGSTTFLTTSDGGQNWVNSNSGFQHEGWNVHYVQRSTGVFLSAPEDTTILGVSQKSPVYRSTTFGLFWTSILPDSLPINTTGDMEGIEGVLYVQSNGGINGTPPIDNLMESTDGGFTWSGVGGPAQGAPGPYRTCDTRFAVTGCGNIVYASDFYAGLWKTVDAPGLMVNNTDTMRPISAIICDTTRQIYYLHNPNMSQIVIESIQILDSTRRPAKTHAVWLDSLPGPYSIIPTDDSASFKLAWHPGAMMDSTATDSATIRVIFYASYLTPCVSEPQLAYDTVLLHVKLLGISVPAEYALSINNIKTDSLLTCMTLDTTIEVINNGCDSLSITSASLAKNAWSITDLAGNKLQLPIRIGSGDTLRLQLRATPTNKAVLYDSLIVTMHYQGHDTLWGAALRTYVKLNTAQPALTTPSTLAFDSLATCDSTEEFLTLANTGCDTLSLNKVDLANGHFELLDTNGAPLALPLKIPTDSSRLVMVRFIPGILGPQSAALRLHYLRSLYAAFDSSNVVMLSGTGAPSGTLSYDTALDFGNVSICNTIKDTLLFRNSSCDSAFLDTLLVSAPFRLLDSAKIPRWISAGGVLQLIVQYHPSSKGVENGTAYLHVWTNSGKTSISDTIRFSGTGTAGTSTFETKPVLTANTFAFDTLSECDHADSVTFTVYNTGCDTLRVTGLTLDPSLSGTFATFADKPLPALLGKGDSLHVTLAITALVTNTYAGNFHIQYTLADGSVHDLTMPVSLTVTTASGASALTLSSPTSFDFKTVHACTVPTPDTTITITNTGCGTDTVILSIAGNGFTLGAKLDTVLITPGGIAKIPIYYDDTSHGNLSSTLTLQTNVKNNNFSNVQLVGKAPPVDTVHFKVAFSSMPVAAGASFMASLVPDIHISGIGLKTIHGVFEYRSDNFEVFPGTAFSTIPGIALGQSGPKRVGANEMLSFDLTAADIPLDPATPVVTLPMIAMVSDSVGGMISVDSLVLNQGDPTFSACELASSAVAAQAALSIQCGDSTLIYYLDGKPLVTAARLRPNPVTSENGYQTTLDLTAAEDGTALIALYDGLGREISHDRILLTHGQQQPYTFDLRNLPAGSYYYDIRFSSIAHDAGLTASGSAKGIMLLVK